MNRKGSPKKTPRKPSRAPSSVTGSARRRPPARGRAAPRAAGAAGSLSEETKAKLDRLQDTFSDLQESMLLTRVHTAMAEVETTLSLLPTEIKQLRKRGYVFRSFLENKIDVLTRQWEEMQTNASSEMKRRIRELERDSDTAEAALNRAMSGNASLVSRAESAISTFESKVDAARGAVEAMYEPVQENVTQTSTQAKEIQSLLDQIDEASFQLFPAEDAVSSCKAQLMETEKGGPEGLLYLTDERLVFEQKEKKATKKVLFIATEKEEIQQLVFAVPIGQIEEVKAGQKGFMGRKEMLELLFTPEADLSGATLRLRGADNEDWAGLIGRVKSGEIGRERSRPKDESVVEAARAAPTTCTTCGAALDVEIVRGMREISCAYCGSVIRL